MAERISLEKPLDSQRHINHPLSLRERARERGCSLNKSARGQGVMAERISLEKPLDSQRHINHPLSLRERARERGSNLFTQCKKSSIPTPIPE